MINLVVIIVCFLSIIQPAVLNILSTKAPKYGNDRRVVCYYGSWAVYRQGLGKFEPEDIDPFVCTHVVYTFAGLDESTNMIKSLDPYNDLPDDYGLGAYLRFTNLTKLNPSLKVILAIGGWNEGSEKYSTMTSDPNARSTFVKSTVPFLTKYGFQGLDVDWEYPTQRGGKPEDRSNFVKLLKELRAEFDQHSLLLSAAMGAGKDNIDAAYDVPAISQYVDYLSVMCYDYHGATWEDFLGHNTPMYPLMTETQEQKYFNVNFSINYWLSLGAPASKINLGMATYGHSYSLTDPNKHDLYDPTNGPGEAGPYTGEAGTLGYNEICVDLQQGGWTVVVNEQVQAPYMYNDREWIAYDDPNSIRIKCLFANEYQLGGGMIWSIETDDFHATCGPKKFPLLAVINEYIRGISPNTTEPTPPPPPTTTPYTGPTTTPPPPPTTELPPPSDVCKHPGYQADPNDCTIFYNCIPTSSGEWQIFTFHCTDGLIYDPSIQSCNYPEDVPDCHAYMKHPHPFNVVFNKV